MADDWRVTVELAGERERLDFVESMQEVVLEGEARSRLGDRVAVSADGPRVFLYADTEQRAREAERVVAPLLARHGLDARVSLARWHPDEEQWEDPAVALPETEEERQAEHERLQQREQEESLQSGHAEWEVRVELPTHGATRELAERLEADGLPVIQRWRFLLVGAVNEDAARELADRLEAEAPEGARIEIELGGDRFWRVLPPNPFAIFGGLGG